MNTRRAATRPDGSTPATGADLTVNTVEWISALKERRLVTIERLLAELRGVAGGAR